MNPLIIIPKYLRVLRGKLSFLKKKVKRDRHKFVGKWVALDDKNRIVSIKDKLSDILESVDEFNQYKKEYGVSIYLLRKKETKESIKELLD